MSDVEVSVEPPDCDHDDGGDGEPSARLHVTLVDADDVVFDTGVQLFDDAARDPERVADALLRATLALAHLAGPDVAWAAVQRFAAYDGTGR